MGSSRWVPRLPSSRQRSPARPKEDCGRAVTDAVWEQPPPGDIWDCPRGSRRPAPFPHYPLETLSTPGPSRPPSAAASPAPVGRPAPGSAAERARSRIQGNPLRPLAPAPANDLGLQGAVPSNQVSESPASPRACSQWNTTPATHPP